ncbi:MAG: hypothetical protein AB7V14_12110 [Kiritimatiellia bacterium]
MKIAKAWILALALGGTATAAMGEALVSKGASEMAIDGMVDFATFQGVETELAVRYGYFFVDRLSVGPKAMLYNNDAVNHLGLGVVAEYNFQLPPNYKPLFGTDLVPFLGGSVEYRRAKLFDETESAGVFGADAGVKFFLTDTTALALSLRGELATEDVYDDDLEATDKNLSLLLGMRLYF